VDLELRDAGSGRGVVLGFVSFRSVATARRIGRRPPPPPHQLLSLYIILGFLFSISGAPTPQRLGFADASLTQTPDTAATTACHREASKRLTCGIFDSSSVDEGLPHSSVVRQILFRLQAGHTATSSKNDFRVWAGLVIPICGNRRQCGRSTPGKGRGGACADRIGKRLLFERLIRTSN